MNLNRIICPGCGKENPKSKVGSCFSCEVCDWEYDGQLPELVAIKNAKRMMTNCNNVNLPAFLRTLLKDK